MISSPSNPHIKDVAGLRKRRSRESTRRFLIEGARPLRRALDASWPVLEVLYDPLAAAAPVLEVVNLARRSGVPVTEVSDSALRKIAYRTEPEGVVAVAEHRQFELDRLPVDPEGLYLVTEAIEKPGNIGAMLRTAEAASATGVIAADGATDLTNPNVVRASQGALFAVPVAAAAADDVLAWLHTNDLEPVAMRADAPVSMWEHDLSGGLAVVIGSEHAGLTSTWDACTAVHVPMAGNVDSLNASTTAALVLYEARRQRSA